MKKISLLGATGSIGTSTLRVLRAYPEQFRLLAFSFYHNVELAREIITEFQPAYVCAGKQTYALLLKKEFPTVEFGYGMDGLIEAAVLSEVDLVLTAVMGSIGVRPTLAAIQAGKQIALANKETLVMAGEIVMNEARRHQVSILPVDSEHSAIFQCLQAQPAKALDALWITASGGSFRDLTREELKYVTVEAALQHPNWSMGKKITIDSATMMNKGLEVIEAHWLFDIEYDKINVVLHRESVVHSLIQLVDGAYLAQLGASDMREPIQYALTYPDRLPMKQPDPFSLMAHSPLHFEEPDMEKYPLLQLAFEVGQAGGAMPTIYNAANEVAVSAFLQKEIPYLSIEKYICQAVQTIENQPGNDLETLIAVDEQTRRQVSQWIKEETD